MSSEQVNEENEKLILVIDDDITSLDIVCFLFEERGYTVEPCANGHSAIDYVKQRQPDILVVDLMMPEINGAETVKQIRALGLTDVPIIAFTAVDDPAVHAEAVDAGCNEVLTKPLHPDRLLQKIERFIN